MINQDIILAEKLLKEDEVVAIPTETVYGLAGNAFSERAVKKIYQIKKRPFYNPLIVHVASIDKLNTVAKNIPDIAFRLADLFWPGPLTLILEKKDNIPDWVTGNKKTVAVRVPNHPLALELLNTLNFPLAAPSANPFGTISPTQANHVKNYFKDQIKLILDGGSCSKGMESTIVGFENNIPILLRHGAISIEEIKSITKNLMLKTHQDTSPIAPGMLTKHYAPKTKTIATTNIIDTIKLHGNLKLGIVVFKEIKYPFNNYDVEILSKNGRMEEAAQNFYAALHKLDDKKLDLIIIEKLPEKNIGNTINDRIQRAITL